MKLLKLFNIIRAIEFHKKNYEINFEELYKNRICVFCGSKLTGKRRKYCSDRCSYLFIHCHYVIYGWEYIRKRVFKRDNYTCQKCNIKKSASGLEAHHIKPRCKGGTDEENNLRTLCKFCHGEETTELLKELFGKGIEYQIKYHGQKRLLEFIGEGF